MRARYPDVEGFVERGGLKIGYEVYGEGDPAVVFVPIDPIVQSRAWKAQVPYFARRHRVVTIDPRGNGRSDRPTDPAQCGDIDLVEDTVAVMDAVSLDKAVLIGLCGSAWHALTVASMYPDRVLGVVSIGTNAPFLTPPLPYKPGPRFNEELDSYEGWDKVNRHYWLQDWRGFAEFFFDQLLPEPHSTKQWEDTVGWAVDIGAETLLTLQEGSTLSESREDTEKVLRGVRCPVLTIHGDDDRCQPISRSERVAEITGGSHLRLVGAGHLPQAREPVVVNHAIRDFLRQFEPPVRRQVVRPLNRPRRVLFLSSPIGLGHSRRDIAIANALREQRPEVEVEWLAQHPLTVLLEQLGETIHPASRYLANESDHLESESAEHDLHAFQSIRRMDEILVNNFMVFSDLVEEREYDAWIGDEAWDLDYFLHENPHLKRTPYVWLTDFVGWVPMPDGGDREAALTADYNADMVDQIGRLPALRDRALFVGSPDDVYPGELGAGLPSIRDWTAEHFDFVGYVSGFDPADVADRDQVRADLGYGQDEKVCVVAVGGSGVGHHLLKRVAACYPEASRAVPGLRFVVVTGPRIDPESLDAPPGVEVHGYVPNLYRQLAACDLAVVQGGLTTTMELTANRRPFVYVPLRHHFEQNFHVRHRLQQYGAGRCLDYDDIDPDHLTHVIAEEIDRPVDYKPVETAGASRAAARIAELI